MKPYNRIVEPNTNNVDVDIMAVDNLINERVLARESKNFRRADGIVKFLLERHNVIVNDSDLTWQTGTKRQVKKRKRVALSKAKAAPASGNNDVSSNTRSNNYEGFQLSSDSGPNKSTLTFEGIVTLLADRRKAQRTRDYEKADNIRNTLKVDGVYVEDGLNEFRWDGVAYKQRGRVTEYSASSSSGGLSQSEYSLALNDDDAERNVNDLLAQRLSARSNGNYAKADAIRDQLFEGFNIRIDDKLREWSVGGNFGSGEDHWSKTNKQPLVGYTRSDFSTNLPQSDERYVQGRVDERMRAKRTRNYELSDSIRDELYRQYNVTIHDKINLWSAGGNFGEGLSWNYDTNLPKTRHLGDEDGEFDSSLDSFVEENLDSGEGDRDSVASSQERESSTSLLREQLECLTVVQLKDKLRNSGFTVSGTKAKLINRLLAGKT